jgi:hypothetical protein
MMEKEKRVKLEHSREPSSTTHDTLDEKLIDNGPKKRNCYKYLYTSYVPFKQFII